MIIANGTIAKEVNSGDGLNEQGNPNTDNLPVLWGDPIPCNVTMNRRDNLGKRNGNTFTVASYEALIEVPPFNAERVLIEAQEFDKVRVKLTEHGRELGEFPVLFTEYLEAVGAIRIVV
jgi:hypothetical protein